MILKFNCIFSKIFIFFSTVSIFFLLSSLAISAQNQTSLLKLQNYFKNGDCNSLVQKIGPFTKKNSWVNRDLWLRSQILNVKCEINLGNAQKALTILNEIKEKEFLDSLIYQKIRALLKLKKYEDAFKNFRLLLKHPKKIFYLNGLRENIKKEFVNDKKIRIVFPLLHETRNEPKLFLKDFEIYSIYKKGAKLNGIKMESKSKLIGWQFPNDEESARKSHKELNENDFKNITSRTILKRVQTLSKLKLNKYLLIHLSQLRFSKDKKLITDLGKTYLKSLYKERHYRKIINLFNKKILSEKWYLEKEIQLYWLSRAHIKRKDIENGRSTIYKLIRHNPKSKFLPILFDQLASRYLIDSETEKAKFWLQKLIKNFPKHRLFTQSTWLLSWTNIKEKNYEKAIFYLSKGLKTKIYNSEMKAKFLFWLGKSYQKFNKFENARKNYKKLIINYPNTYYGMRLLSSKNDLKNLFDTKISNQEVPFFEPSQKLSKRSKTILRRSNFLFDIAEFDQAKDELFSGLGKFKNKSLNWNASNLLDKKGYHKEVLRIVANSFLPKMKKLDVRDSKIWRLAYPKPYWKLVKEYSSQAGIDPFFALAIMREESHFDTMALSSSKAMGLMQLMPNTAKEVAKKKKIKLPNKEKIFDHIINIQLGIFYLGQIARKFQSELIYTAGSYNAGPHNMKKWLNRFNGIKIDEFVESIPYKETKNYVKRVYLTYKIYKNIYSS